MISILPAILIHQSALYSRGAISPAEAHDSLSSQANHCQRWAMSINQFILNHDLTDDPALSYP
jgi:hypothetical protein